MLPAESFFRSLLGNETIATGNFPSPLAIGDFNNDGFLDLVVGNYSSNNVTVFLGGAGGFVRPGSTFATGTNPAAIVVADFNGDGNSDLAVTNNISNNVTVLLGNGSGGFTAASGSPFATGPYPWGIAAADFNSDGKIDLAITNDLAQSVTVLLGNGTGGFTPAPGSPLIVGQGPTAIVAADFNADGKTDLLVSNAGDNSVTLLLGDGAGGFAPGLGSPFTGASGYSMVLGDFNGDGRPDLAMAGNGVIVLLGSAAPQTDSVTPSSGSGLTQTFSFNYSSARGYNYLSAVYGLVNSNLVGAVGCFFQYTQPTNTLSLYTDTANALAGSLTPGQAASISNSQCTINGLGFTASGSGAQLRLGIPVTFNNTFTGAKTVYGYATDQGNLNSGWKQLGAWNIGSNSPPTADSVSPNAGSAVSQTFTFKYSSASGYGNLTAVYGLMNSNLSSSAGCFFWYYAPNNTLYLYNDAGNAVAGTLTPGAASSINNSQCTIAGTGLSASGSGNQLTLAVPITFSSTFKNIKTLYGYAIDNASLNSGFQTLGTWTTGVVVNTPPTADSVTPSSGTGISQTFTMKYSSVNGFSYLSTLYGLINSSLSGTGGCTFIYYAPNSTLYLYTDAGNAVAGTLTPGAASSINNGQCTISGSAFTASGSGNQLALTIPITFNSAFVGVKTLYGYASDQATLSSGWTTLGTWMTASIINAPPTADSVSVSGYGTNQTVTLKYSSVNGHGYLTDVFGIMNKGLSVAGGCVFLYDLPTNTLYLYNDAGDGVAGTLRPGVGASVHNSECTINGTTLTASGSGNQFTLAVPMFFFNTFPGPWNVYGYSADQGNLNSGWQTLGVIP